MLTIGEVARLAGTTTKAVRHYHAHGLLPEPGRDDSGYRRYGATALVRLLRIRRLRELGLSVPRIRRMLSEGPATVREALAELDRELAARQRAIAAQRRVIADLRDTTADLDLPEPVAELFDELNLDGLDGDLLELEKSAVLLMHALAPEHTGEVAEFFRKIWREHRALAERIATGLQALATAPEDAPEIEPLVADLVELVQLGHWTPGTPVEPQGSALIADYFAGFSPAQRRALMLLAERVSGFVPPPG